MEGYFQLSPVNGLKIAVTEGNLPAIQKTKRIIIREI